MARRELQSGLSVAGAGGGLSGRGGSGGRGSGSGAGAPPCCTAIGPLGGLAALTRMSASGT